MIMDLFFFCANEDDAAGSELGCPIHDVFHTEAIRARHDSSR